ncbi:MAG TPA: hypothetical protein VFC99_04355 [Acidimicrobiia bacterium]|nr:hypothetical protein [Acidimicrobiia bacterium]
MTQTDAGTDGVAPFPLEPNTELYDPLTGLPGPVLLIDRLEVALASARRRGGRVAVFVLFDACLTGAGEPPVWIVANRLRSLVRPDDTVARATNRTFAVVCNAVTSTADAESIADRLLEPVGGSCRLGLAIGGPRKDARALLARAVHRAASAPAKSTMPARSDAVPTVGSEAGVQERDRRCSEQPW